MRAGQELSASAGGARKTRPLTEQNAHRPIWSGRRITMTLLDEADGADDEVATEQRHVTWQKVVETPSRPPAVHPPRPPLPPQSHSILRNMPYRRSQGSPVVLFWSSVVVLLFFVAGGVLGIVGTLGRGRTAPVIGATLQITPDDVSMGATMNLRGTGFSSRAQIGFSRDAAIPVADTNGSTIITSRADGSFTDTIIVGPDWISGTHTISAEDAVTHKFTSSPVQVTGMGDLLRPAHLELSAASLDLGAGDQAVDSVQKVALTNLGGGQISWQANATQPWLTISPKSGTFSSGMKTEVEIAGDRSHLPPGSFNDQVLFTSSAGDSALPIKMSVTSLLPQQAAVLQISPAVLSFSGSDGGSAPDAQVVTINNPGQLPLHWTSETNVPWLILSSQGGSIDASASGQVNVNVDTSNLLPGTYNGTITFQGDGAGAVVHNLQSVLVSVTITPGCALAVASDMLTFTAGYQQSAPAAKAINLSATNCSSSMAWKATSHASWLTVSQTSGSTPASPAIGINATGLNPGTYTSSVTFSSSNGTQEVPVKFIMSQLTEPVLNVGSTAGLNFYGGQGGVATQNVTLTNTGSGTLLWSANAMTGSGGGWLAVSPGSGSISAHQSTVLAVTSTTLASMVPGTYSGTINIAATDQQGRAIAGSPQHIPVSKVVNAVCTVSVSASALTFSGVAGQPAPANQSIILTAGSGCGNLLNWSAADNGGKWLTTTATTGSVSASNQGAIGIGVALNGLAAGSYHGTVTITTLDSITHAAIGNPHVVNVLLNVASSPPLSPSVEVSATAVSFSTTAGTNPASQTITIVNTGTVGVSWQAATPSQPWLSISPGSGRAAVEASSTVTLSVNVEGLATGTHGATIALKPSSGPALIIKVSLRINEAAPTPTVAPTPLPTATPQPTPVPTATPVPVPIPSPNPPTPTPTSRGAPPPVQTVVPSPSPHPTAVPTPQPTATPSPSPSPSAVSIQNPVPTPTALPTPTRRKKNNYPPSGHMNAIPSPTVSPKFVPTEVPAVKPTPDSEDLPTPTPIRNIRNEGA